MLSESRISEIKKRKDAATPGPWQCLSAEFTKLGVNFEMVMSEKVIAFPDAKFLAHSITDVSDLLAEREELVRELETRNKPTRNSEALTSFTEYCRAYPENRFWQALRKWSKWNYILGTNDPVAKNHPNVVDTFYLEGLDGTCHSSPVAPEGK